MLGLIQNAAIEFWTVLCEMSPYLLFGFFFAGLLSIFIHPELVERHLGGKGFGPILKASAIGVPLPLCSCGVIPVAASLRKSGASKPATTSFLASTPQTGVDSILVTYSLLGPVFALFRPIAALLSGLMAGGLVALFDTQETGGHATGGSQSCDSCEEDGGSGSKLAAVFRHGFVTLPKDIGKSLAIGLVLAGLIAAVIPDDFFSTLVGPGLLMMFLMMLLGVPLYVCATASVPVAAALIEKGVTPGAALVFLMTGPATNAATIAVIWKTMGRRTALLYLVSIAASALASGLILDYGFHMVGETGHVHMSHMLPWSLHVASAIALLGVLAYAWMPRKRKKEPVTSKELQGHPITLSIQGMTCSHCVQTVERTLKAGKGVTDVRVDLKGNKALVWGEHVDPQALVDAVNQAGYEATV